MAYKTMLRQLISKWGIMSIEMRDVITKDDCILRENNAMTQICRRGLNLTAATN